jgi:hypothetical protein
LQILASNCRCLETISLTIDSDTDEYFLSNTTHKEYVVNLLQNNRKLIFIKLDITEMPSDDDFGSNPAAVDLLDVLAEYCPVSIEICILRCIGLLNSMSVVNLLLSHTKLTELNITKYDFSMERKLLYVRSSVMKKVSCRSFHDPESNIDKGDFNVGHIFVYVVGFTHIELLTIIDLSDAFVRVVANNNFTTLLHLTIDSCGTNWSSHSICHVLTICKQLNYLGLLDCDHLTEYDFVQMCFPENVLVKLTINNASALSTAILVRFLTHSKFVLELHIENCYNVSRSVVQQFCNDYRPDVLLCPQKGAQFW